MNRGPEAVAAARIEARWRGPTIAEIARASGVGTATVDRVLNGRSRVREATRRKVLDTLSALSRDPATAPSSPRRLIAFIVESGISFNEALREAVAVLARDSPTVQCSITAIQTGEADPARFAQHLERAAGAADGLVVVAREDLTVNRAVRALTLRGVPVICLTTDLPSSGRLAYVGSDQASAGATAAYLIGRVLGARSGRILLVMSAPYRAQEERELGFRRVLRADFPGLVVEERLNSHDDVERSYENLRKYLQEHEPPLGIYNVAGGNRGIARALREAGLAGQVLFVGHEMTANSRILLESGAMDFVIGHDFDREVAQSVALIEAHLEGHPAAPSTTPVRIYTKYNCS